MPKFRHILLISASLAVLLWSCKSPAFTGVGMAEVPRLQKPLSMQAEKLQYKVRAFTGRGEVSGIMIIKKMLDDGYRVAFFNEVGMSFMEASMGPGEYPYALDTRLVSPLISQDIIEYSALLLNLLLVPAEVLQRSDLVKDALDNPWIAISLEKGKTYYGHIDHHGRISEAFISKAGKARSAYKAYFDFSDEGSSVPVSARLTGKNGHTVLEINAI